MKTIFMLTGRTLKRHLAKLDSANKPMMLTVKYRRHTKLTLRLVAVSNSSEAKSTAMQPCMLEQKLN